MKHSSGRLGMARSGMARSGMVSHGKSKVAIAFLLTLCLSSCLSRPGSDTVDTVSGNESTTAASDVANAETQVRITVPADWTVIRDDRRQSADIQAVYPPSDLYAKVLSESASVLNIFDLENNAEQYRWLIQQELDRFEGETPTGLTSLNGQRAVQYEMRGVVDGTPVVYLHTTVQGSEDYYQVVGWTTEASYQINKETLQKVIESFRGT
ncbi:MAG: hypothetical protein AAF703_15565 [Cyanobacteria bacterium P01_D01_bin.105]